MFRAGKLNVHGLNRQTVLAKRMLNVSRLHRQRVPVPGSAPGGLSATAQLSGAGAQQKQNLQQIQEKVLTQNSSNEADNNSRYPRKIFSGIQPTGALHLGNYLGAVRRWTQLQNARDDVTICIVDLHSITMPHNPPALRENIFEMAATLLACGIDPARTTLFVQSAVLEHCEFNWILSSLATMPRLAQLPQFKEKSRMLRDVPLGLYVYPVLQAADIMLYKSTHVPVGVDQLQHIQLAQHLSRSFNSRYGEIFPVCRAIIEENDASRVLSLRDPSKKMSKSESNPKGAIYLSDSPEVIAEKIKKAVTDFTSDISYNNIGRPGVSNLVNIHAQVTGQSIKSVVEEAKTLDTARYKERVAEAVIAHLTPIRERIQQHMAKRNELIYMLDVGAEKARQTAQQTMSDVKQRLGLGTNANLPAPVRVPQLLPELSKMTASQRVAKGVLPPDVNAHAQPHFEQRSDTVNAALGGISTIPGDTGSTITGELHEVRRVMARPRTRRPVVPTQSLRVEKEVYKGPPKHVFKMDTRNMPNIGFRAPLMPPSAAAGIVTGALKSPRRPVPQVNSGMGFSQTQQTTANVAGKAPKFPPLNANRSAVAAITSAVNAATKQQEIACSLANSSFYKAAVAAYANSSTINAGPGMNIGNRSGSSSSHSSSPSSDKSSSNTEASEEEEGVTSEDQEEYDEHTEETEDIKKVEN